MAISPSWHLGGIESVAISSALSLCASGARDGSVRLTQLTTHKIVASFAHTSENEEENCSVEAWAFRGSFMQVGVQRPFPLAGFRGDERSGDAV